MAKSNLLHNAFVQESAQTLDFIETSKVYELKLGTYSRFSEYMNT